MRNIILLTLLVLLGCGSESKDGFVLSGTIPGAPNGMKVELFPEGGFGLPASVENGQFEIQGKVDEPTHCLLRLRNDAQQFWKVDFIVENGNLYFETPHLDSLSPMFKGEEIRKEVNYTLTGSKVQERYYRYQQKNVALRCAIEDLLAKSKAAADTTLYRQAQAKQRELERVTMDFIRSQQNLEVNLYLAKIFWREPFNYDEAYVDEVLGLFESYRDTCSALRDFREKWEGYRSFARGKKLEDAKIYTPDGKEMSLLAQLREEEYTFIDFWTSWCVSCRAGFPRLREIYEGYKDKVKFVGISLDGNREAWEKALKEEDVPWPMFIGTAQLSRDKYRLYGTNTIPTYMVIDSTGEIVAFCGLDRLELELKILLNK